MLIVPFILFFVYSFHILPKEKLAEYFIAFSITIGIAAWFIIGASLFSNCDEKE